MATNQLAAFGLRPLRHMSTKGNVTSEYKIASGYASSIGLGDPVKLNATGTIEKADAGDTIIGVYQGGYKKTNGSQGSLTDLNPYFKDFVGGTTVTSAQTLKALVIDDPTEIWAAQVLGTVTEADIGKTVDWVDQPVKSIYGASAGGVTGATPGRAITVGALTVTNGGTGYSDQTYITFDGDFIGVQYSITIASGVITAISVTHGGAAGTDATPAVTVTDPAGTGSGAVIADYTSVALSASTQFIVEEILDWPIQMVNASTGAHEGFGLSGGDGTNKFVALRCATGKHQRAI